MPKLRTIVGAKVILEVDPPSRRDQTYDAFWRAAVEIKRQVDRHCDGVIGVEIDIAAEETCSFCNAQWTENDSKYNGGCCDKDEEEKESSQ